MIFGLPKSLILVLTAAFAYAIATFGIKLASGAVSPLATGLILFGFLLAAAAETVLLRQSDLGAIYLAIIAVETIVILTIAAVIGEGLNLKQFFGAGLILGGIVLVGH
ncbi:MAG: 5-aminolevulinate synthase [Rhodobacteraceae bacterium]|nr:5-aminolevulinate synthase [Paracoccaceae bacterium]